MNRLRWNTDGSLLYSYDPANDNKAASSAALMNSLNGDYYGGATGTGSSYLINFPSPVSLSKLVIKNQIGTNITVQVSSDSADGLNSSGTWTTLVNAAAYTGNAIQEFTFAPTSCLWVRVSGSFVAQSYPRLYALHLFGEYTTPRFEAWDAAGSAELTAEYPLSLSAAYNASDSVRTAEFKLKNVSGGVRSYSLAALAVKYGGDAIVTSHISVSPTTITDLADGALSAVITLTMDLDAADNTADGWHQYAVDVTETA